MEEEPVIPVSQPPTTETKRATNVTGPITVAEVYRENQEDIRFPSGFRIVGFAPPKPRQKFISVIGHIGEDGMTRAIQTATALFPDLCPRLIVEEIEPCEMCGAMEPVAMTEIKKSDRAKNYSLMMLCAGCVEKNKSLVK